MLNTEIRPVLTPAKVGISRENVAAVQSAGNTNTETQATNEMYAAWQHDQQRRQYAESHHPDDLPF